VYGVDFGTEGSRLVSAGTDGQVLVWDSGSWKPFGPPRTHDFAVDVLGVEVSPDGGTIASADNGGAIKLWPAREPGALAQTVGAPGGLVWDLAVTSNDVVAAASGLRGIELWSKSAISDDGAPKSVALIPREKLGQFEGACAKEPCGTSYEVVSHDSLVVGSTGYTFGVWDLDSSEPQLLARSDPAKHPAQWISALAVTRDGNTVASADFVGNIVLWDISNRESARFLAALDHGERPVDALAFSASGELLASGDRGGAVRLWDVSDPTEPAARGERFVAHLSDPVWALAFSPADDGFLVSGGGDRRVALWNVQDPEQVEPSGRPLLHSNSVLGLSFDSEGTILAVADGDAGAVLYDVETRHPLGLGMVGYAGANATFEAVAFDADEETLYSAGQLNPVLAWDSALWTGDSETLRENACRLARRDLTEEEWAEVFRETKLEDSYRRTCTE
jgi:WD40 repeat protein